MKLRRTKIIATLGPATDADGVLEGIIAAGVDLVRVNLSHGSHEAHAERIEATRQAAKKLKKEVGILLDLQGPKIRIARFKEGSVILKAGDPFILDAELDSNAGTSTAVGIDYPHLPRDLQVNDILLLDDGFIVLKVEKIIDSKIYCLVVTGGKLSNNKGINRKGGGLTAKALTEKDEHDIVFASKMKVDYVALSFPRSAEDMKATRNLLEKAHSTAGLIAKIERVEAIEALDTIIEASDAVMVARGDLGVEIGFAELPALQKHIIVRARALNKAVITATQMMESMIAQPIPTRAEVSDVANAVLDGTDAVMLSAETATGKFPEKVVAMMAEICLAAERAKNAQMHSHHRSEFKIKRIDETIADAAMYTANYIDAKAIIALTESGRTPLWMSRIRSGIPIYGLSRNKEARGRMTLYRGVYPIDFDVTGFPPLEVPKEAMQALIHLKAIEKGDNIILTKGDIMGKAAGGANSLQILVA